jgi:hypothetical protein
LKFKAKRELKRINSWRLLEEQNKNRPAPNLSEKHIRSSYQPIHDQENAKNEGTIIIHLKKSIIIHPE